MTVSINQIGQVFLKDDGTSGYIGISGITANIASLTSAVHQNDSVQFSSITADSYFVGSQGGLNHTTPLNCVNSVTSQKGLITAISDIAISAITAGLAATSGIVVINNTPGTNTQFLTCVSAQKGFVTGATNISVSSITSGLDQYWQTTGSGVMPKTSGYNVVVDSTGRFVANSKSGGNSNPTITFTDQGSQNHMIEIKAGIITSWTINTIEQLS